MVKSFCRLLFSPSQKAVYARPENSGPARTGTRELKTERRTMYEHDSSFIFLRQSTGPTDLNIPLSYGMPVYCCRSDFYLDYRIV